MKQILVIEVSPRGSVSASRKVNQKLLERLKERFPDAKFVHRDLASERMPYLDDSTIKYLFSKNPSEALANAELSRFSDKLTEELLASDLLVIATPMWNFGIPSMLKAWIDLVVRPGKTFLYTSTGVEGLAKNKTAILIEASGGVFTDGPWKSWDFVDPYLRQILKFIGIENVQTVRAEGMNIPAISDQAVPNAEKAIMALKF
jgi:FMN-dependent NADH-azoreductase